MKHQYFKYYIGPIYKVTDITFLMSQGSKGSLIKVIPQTKKIGEDIFYQKDENTFYGINTKKLYPSTSKKIAKKIIIKNKLIPIIDVFEHLNIKKNFSLDHK